jgi:CHAT domain-containing protein/tetratricopeptide (TPR) repeat protein
VLIAAAAMVACTDRPTVASEISTQPTHASVAPASLVALAESTYFRAQYDSARAMLDDAIRRAPDDSALQARALTWIGLVAFRQGDYATAHTIGERALALKLRRRFDTDLFRSYNALGLLAWQEGRFHEAIRLFGRAADAARTTHDSAAHATALGNLGSVQMDVGAFSEAREGLLEMQRVAHARGNARTEANATNNLGLLAIRLGDPAAAVELLGRARALYRTAGSPVGEENALGQLGTAYDALGDPQRAFAYLDSALDLAQRHGLRKEAAEDLQLTAEIYGRSGDHQRALEYLGRASRLADSLGARATQAMIARDAARAQAALGRLDLARERAGAAARLHGEAGARYERALDLILLAEVAQRAGDGPAAQRTLAEAVSIARELDAPVATAQVGLGAARVADAARDPRATLRALDEAQASLPSVRLGVEWEMHALRARAYAATGRTLDAIGEGRRAVASVERVRGLLVSEALRSAYRADRAAVYADLVVALLRADSVSAAFEVADGARGRVLLDQLAAAQRDLGTDPNTRRVADAERLLRRIAALQARLRAMDTVRTRDRAAGVVETATLAEDLSRAEREYEALIERAGVRRPGDATLLGAGRPDAALVRRSLASDEALVEFLVTPERLFTFIVRHDGVRSLESPVSAGDLLNRVRLARDLIARGGDAGPREAVLGALHGILVAPAERAGLLHGARTLIVVPHSGLAYLPFAALFDAAHGRYLVESYAVSTMPSATALADARGRASTSGQPAVVLAPVPGELPGTRAEAIAVARATTAPAPLVGSSATEAALRRALGRSGVVHVATHGVMNARSPMFSRLELAPGTGEGSDDGRLEIHELLGMRIRSPLVFLSGCETALGTSWSTSFARGDDYATLAQAFLYTGAGSVVATLWRIDDEGAAAFAAAFYDALRTRPPVDALASAQRALLSDPRYVRFSSPRYWAAYVLAGRGHAAAQNSVRLSVQ